MDPSLSWKMHVHSYKSYHTIQVTLSYLKTLHVYIPRVTLSRLGGPCPSWGGPHI